MVAASSFSRRFYGVTRDLHLYSGLFFAPFVLVFSVSVFFLVHRWIPSAREGEPRVVREVVAPSNLEALGGRARIEALHGVLAGIGVTGEIGFVRHEPKERRMLMPAVAPGHETMVDWT